MRNRELDGLRGLAALSVALGHCLTATFGIDVLLKNADDFPSMSWQQIVGRLGHVLFPADAAVVVFFVLSGYVLWGSLMRRESGSLGDCLPYAVTRAYRLLPVAIASAVTLGFLVPTTSLDLVKNALLLSYNINGPIWSLQVEVVGSLLIFAMFALVSRTTPLLLVALMPALLFAAVQNQHYLVLFLPTFAAGASIHYMPARLFAARWLLGAAYVPLILADLMLGHNLNSRLVAFSAAFVLVGVVATNRPKFFGSRPAHFLGEISYPFYLFHTTGAVLAHRVIDSAGGMPENQFAAFLVYAVVSIGFALPIAYLAHIFVEKPGMQAGASVTANLRILLMKPRLVTERTSPLAVAD